MTKKEEMIKSEIVINPEMGSVKVGDKSSTDIVLECALKKEGNY